MGVQETNLELKPKKVGISVTTVGSRRSKNHQDVDLIKKYRLNNPERIETNRNRDVQRLKTLKKCMHFYVHVYFK